jgi:hypothetical protein
VLTSGERVLEPLFPGDGCLGLGGAIRLHTIFMSLPHLVLVEEEERLHPQP